ncbi:Sec-independent protein translocase protein TatB [Thalassospira alkalitolerans]|uniref:Sec-independent protein translocase protein TatB n=1 Tax=Thalassospira alkalitolerans TaxID=1293890 RepID=UPI0030EBB249|tara:strand:- start:20113 stop:20613 length:501 start_codon:yes stop_codon:yes gene_type:complete
MFDIGWTEMALVAVVALFVVGPKDLPHVLYKLAGYWKKVRGMAREFQGGVDNLIREAELDDLRKQVTDARASTSDFIENKIGDPKATPNPAATKSVEAKATDVKAEAKSDVKSEPKAPASKAVASKNSNSKKTTPKKSAPKAPASKPDTKATAAAGKKTDHPESQA